MPSERFFAVDLATPAAPMTAADIDAFIARAKAERAVTLRAGAVRLGRRLRRLLAAQRIGRGNLPRNGIWASHA